MLQDQIDLHLCELSFLSLLALKKQGEILILKGIQGSKIVFPCFHVSYFLTLKIPNTLRNTFTGHEWRMWRNKMCKNRQFFCSTWHQLLKPQGAGPTLRFVHMNTTQFNIIRWCEAHLLRHQALEQKSLMKKGKLRMKLTFCRFFWELLLPSIFLIHNCKS